jgi:hypothetical protein
VNAPQSSLTTSTLLWKSRPAHIISGPVLVFC